MKRKLTVNERMAAYAELANGFFQKGQNALGAHWAQNGFDAWVRFVKEAAA
jgi:hypothetical protein